MQALDVPTLISPAPKAPASHLSDLRFDTLSLHPVLLDNLRRLGYSHCTPIQAQTLPRALAGEDLAGQAQTGTGKTAAFLLALLNHLLTRPAGEHLPRALVLAPTRELALQIYNDALALTVDTSIRLVAVYGGTGYETQRSSIETGAEVLIGTPGRLIDFFKQEVFTLKGIEVLVLDEADRMFDLGFIADIRYLMRRMPPPAQRRNYLFSATLSHRVLELAYEHMNNPTRVEIEPEQVTAERVRQSLIHVANDEKLRLLVGLLRRQDGLDPGGRTMVFVNTKRVAEQVEATLNGNRLKAATLSGDVPQNKRERLLEEFRSGELPILVATDVAARGLHISDVSCVINFDLPQDAQDYVHRIGRTARAGASGDAISMCCETYVYSLPDIEALIGQRIAGFADVDAVMPTDFVVVKVARSADSRSGARPHRGGSRPPPRRR